MGTNPYDFVFDGSSVALITDLVLFIPLSI
jgi:hypothetical protein